MPLVIKYMTGVFWLVSFVLLCYVLHLPLYVSQDIPDMRNLHTICFLFASGITILFLQYRIRSRC